MKKLKVKDSKLLSMILYQDNYSIDNEKDANKLIKTLNNNLKALYEQLEEVEIEGVDQYLIGDVINLLDNLKVIDND